jgi:hypothetical protein
MMSRWLGWLIFTSLCWLSLAFAGQTSGTQKPNPDEARLIAAKVATDNSSLLDFLRKRTLTEDLREQAELLVTQLGASSFKDRDKAMKELMAGGPAVLEVIRHGLNHPDRAVQSLCQTCIQKIKDGDCPPAVPAAVVRLLAQRQAPGALEAILNYAPTAENEMVIDDSVDAFTRLAIKDALAKLAVKNGAVERSIMGALVDKAPILRGLSAELLIQSGAKDQGTAVKALLRDAEPSVRYRVAMALAAAGDKDSIPTLLDLLPEASQGQAWAIEDLMYRLAEGKQPPSVVLRSNDASRKEWRDAWQRWWKMHAGSINAAILKSQPRLVGVTTMVLLDLARVVEVDSKNTVLWQIDALNVPLDVEVLGPDRVLIAEFGERGSGKGRVTERNFEGKILWQYNYGFKGRSLHDEEGPIVAQRLANGNTFIAGNTGMVEVNASGVVKACPRLPRGGSIYKCSKLPNGEVVCLVSDRGWELPRVVRLDADFHFLSDFPIRSPDLKFIGGRLQGLANGHVLVPQRRQNKVVEYDSAGNEVWSIAVDEPIIATRLPSGNTMVTSYNHNRAVEYDPSGKVVWQSVQEAWVTRAIRR